jgi:hypothetical protein
MLKSLFVFLFLITQFNLFSQDLNEIYVKNIDTTDLRTHLSVLAGDRLKGRKTGTKGQKQAAKYIRKQFVSIGIQPPSALGYFQTFQLLKKNKSGKMSINQSHLTFPKDFGFLSFFQPSTIDIKSVYYVLGTDLMATKTNFNKDFLLIEIEDFSSFSEDMLAQFQCKGILFLVRNYNEAYFTKYKTENLALLQEHAKMPFIFLNKNTFPSEVLSQLKLNSSNEFKATFELNSKPRFVSTENVVGFIEGNDSILKKEVIVISAHYDHLGIKNKKIYNGADDNGSGTCALLEIAQAFQMAKQAGKNPKRSILFIALTGEEMGLLGSSYYVNNPIFPLAQTVADFNIDMIGRATYPAEKDTFSVYVIGSSMLSNDLHQTQENANLKYTHLKLDYKYNDVNEPLRLYYRSDHFNFAKNNIPSVFYFGGFHSDYHEETDEIQFINFEKIKQISSFVFHSVWMIGNAEMRPLLNH